MVGFVFVLLKVEVGEEGSESDVVWERAVEFTVVLGEKPEDDFEGEAGLFHEFDRVEVVGRVEF